MKILTHGHKYFLQNLDNPDNGQDVQFIEKKPITYHNSPEFWADGKLPEDGTLYTAYDGTTNEEVLKMLIDRMYFLQNAFPCKENAIVITNLEESLMWLDKRTADREKRNVEGKNIK